MTTIDPTAMVVDRDRTGEDGGWHWAEAATSQWTTAAEQAGLTVEVASVEVPDANRDAVIVTVNGAGYLITVRNGKIRAIGQ
ncbi:hypothetical protein [Nonomuraea sp. NPDC049400]|uniref:hypothetical protein n=1 Tax=Nonomuraea sp. NPDC049400 TaxID=3364352 RepID=UPI0037BAE06E